jgi:small-conductance mechanosensitive channel
MNLVESAAELVAAYTWPSGAYLLAALLVLLQNKKIARHLTSGRKALLAIVEFGLAMSVFIFLAAFIHLFLSGNTLFHPATWLPMTTLFGLCLVGGLFAAKAIHAFWEHRFGSRQLSPAPTIPGLLRGVIYGVCLLVAGIIFVWQLGYSLTGIWVSTGLATALIGFALQQTLGDFFSGIALSLERSFRIGDWLQMEDGAHGQVIDINWRATWLKDWDNTTHVIPNAKLAAQGYKNLHNEYHYYHPWYFVKVSAEVDPRFVKQLLLEAAFRCRHVLDQPPPVVRLTDGSSQPYTYMVWVFFANYPTMYRGREELYREIHYALKRAGIGPATDIHEWRTRRAEIPTAEPPTIYLALKSLDLFNGFPDDEIEEIARSSQQLNYDADSRIVLEGDIQDSLDIITSGIIESRMKTSDGQKTYLGQLNPGQYFGLISMLTNQPSIFEYRALTDVTLIRVGLERMREVLRKHPDLADHYAAIVEQRLAEAELVRGTNEAQPVSNTSNHVKRIIKKLIG